MRNKLLATVAMTALIGCTSFAVAQNAGPQGGAMQSQGAQQHQGNPGGAMSTPSGGNAQIEPSTSTPQGSSPEGKGFSQEEPKKSSTPQRGAQEQRGPQNQRGAQGNGQAGQAVRKTSAAPNRQRIGQRPSRIQTASQDQDRGKAVPGQAQQKRHQRPCRRRFGPALAGPAHQDQGRHRRRSQRGACRPCGLQHPRRRGRSQDRSRRGAAARGRDHRSGIPRLRVCRGRRSALDHRSEHVGNRRHPAGVTFARRKRMEARVGARRGLLLGTVQTICSGDNLHGRSPRSIWMVGWPMPKRCCKPT